MIFSTKMSKTCLLVVLFPIFKVIFQSKTCLNSKKLGVGLIRGGEVIKFCASKEGGLVIRGGLKREGG